MSETFQNYVPRAGAAAAVLGPGSVVFNSAVLRNFAVASRTRRCDVAMVTDSNGMHGSDDGPGGWINSYEAAWRAVVGSYGSGILPFAVNADSGFLGNPLYGPNGGGLFGWGKAGGAPAQLTQYAMPASPLGNPPENYGYLPHGSSVSASDGQAHGIITVSATPPWGDINKAIRFHITYGTFPSAAGPGVFRPNIRLDASPFTVITDTPGGSINVCAPDAYGLVDYYIDAPATSGRTDGLIFEASKVSSVNFSGPFWASYCRFESPTVTAGVAVSSLFHQGSYDMRNAALFLQAASDIALNEWLRQAVRLQNDTPVLLVHIIMGGNDQADGNTSVGPNPAASNTPQGFADNVEAAIIRLRAAWIYGGRDPSGLLFCVGPYHPTTGYLTLQQQYETACAALIDRYPTLCVIRGSAVASVADFVANDWYNSDGPAHLKVAGYDAYAARTLQTIIGESSRTLAALSRLAPTADTVVSFDGDGNADLLSMDAFATAADVAGLVASLAGKASLAANTYTGTQTTSYGAFADFAYDRINNTQTTLGQSAGLYVTHSELNIFGSLRLIVDASLNSHWSFELAHGTPRMELYNNQPGIGIPNGVPSALAGTAGGIIFFDAGVLKVLQGDGTVKTVTVA